MDYETLKVNADKQWHALERLRQPLITIGMGTCGQAAGAKGVLSALDQGLKRMRMMGRIMQVVTPQEFGEVVNAIVDAVEAPDSRPLCKR